MLSVSFLLRKTVKLLLCCHFMVICSTDYAQTANVSDVDKSYSAITADNNKALLDLIQQVDSVSRTAGIPSSFAKIYTASLSNIGVQFAGMDSGAQAFITKFEISFINYFLDACREFNRGHLSPGSVWYFYFSHPAAKPWQLTLIGVNAHINGDIWKALVKNCSEQEIRRYKKNLLSFQSSISKAFQPFFDELMKESSYLRFMNGFTKGAARRYGEWLIYSWRLRQINLAIQYYHHPERFKERFAVVKKRKEKIDRMILRKKNLPVL